MPATPTMGRRGMAEVQSKKIDELTSDVPPGARLAGRNRSRSSGGSSNHPRTIEGQQVKNVGRVHTDLLWIKKGLREPDSKPAMRTIGVK